MERWEIMERTVLVAAGIALIGWAAWLVWDGEWAAFAIMLTPIIYWLFWQALFEDKLGSDQPVSRAERLMYRTFIWVRRLVMGAISLALLALTVMLAVDGMNLGALIAAGLSLGAGWTALFGAGKNASMCDDLRSHRYRAKRYQK